MLKSFVSRGQTSGKPNKNNSNKNLPYPHPAPILHQEERAPHPVVSLQYFEAEHHFLAPLDLPAGLAEQVGLRPALGGQHHHFRHQSPTRALPPLEPASYLPAALLRLVQGRLLRAAVAKEVQNMALVTKHHPSRSFAKRTSRRHLLHRFSPWRLLAQ